MQRSFLKITKADIALAVIFLLAAALLLAWSFRYFSGNANEVEISRDGEIVGSYSLAENREIDVGGGSNVVVIEDGKVYMKSADCKNQHCVNHAPISRANEQIVCLPNKVLVEIKQNGESEIDTIAN